MENQGKVIVGEKYNRLTAMEFLGDRKGQKLWLWKCDCGKEYQALAGKVRAGVTKSCGCWNLENVRTMHKTHGAFGTPEYQIWAAVIQRCTNQNNRAYPDYGGRGIQICDRWRNSFEAFLEDMGKRPSKKHEIDRINNDGNYEPGNCRWTTKAEQARNKRNNTWLEFGGRTLIVKDFAKLIDIGYMRVRYLLKRGYTPDEIYLGAKAGKRFKSVHSVTEKQHVIDYDKIFGEGQYRVVNVDKSNSNFDITEIVIEV